LVAVTVRPGANAAKVAAEVRRVLSEEVKERTLVQLDGKAANAALQKKEWLNTSQVTALADPAVITAERHGPTVLVEWLLACVAIGLALLWLRRRWTLAQRSKGIVPVPAIA
jgi:hypothetical protein